MAFSQNVNRGWYVQRIPFHQWVLGLCHTSRDSSWVFTALTVLEREMLHRV